MSGLNKYAYKQRRNQRRKNAIAKDLKTPKYGQRRVEDKKKIQIRDMTHRELVELLNEKSQDVIEEIIKE